NRFHRLRLKSSVLPDALGLVFSHKDPYIGNVVGILERCRGPFHQSLLCIAADACWSFDKHNRHLFLLLHFGLYHKDGSSHQKDAVASSSYPNRSLIKGLIKGARAVIGEQAAASCCKILDEGD